MRREHSAKKPLLITVLAMLFIYILISIALAVQHPLKQGGSSSTAEVELLQQSLNVDQNYNLAIEGIFGSAQSAKSLTEDGVFGTQTWNKLSSLKGIGISTISTVAGSDGSIAPVASQQVVEENTVISPITQSSENKVEDIKGDGDVSRGTKTTSAVLIPVGDDIANFWQNRTTWLQPVKGLQTADPTGGGRYFGAPRANGRAHAAIDFIAPNGRLVYAMTDGKVIRTSLFFQNTSAVEVQNTDGTIARYCEIAPAVSVNTIVHRGDVIGKIITNNGGTSMLHLEIYKGTGSGSLSQSSNIHNYSYVTVRNYERRSDLIDPTGAKYLPIK